MPAVPVADRDGRVQLADDVGAVPARMERQVARPDPGAQPQLPLYLQLAGGLVELAHPHRVRAQVHGQRPAARGVGQHHVGVRPLLALRVRAVALVRHDGDGPAEAAVHGDREHADGAGGVVGGQQVALVQRQMGGRAAADGHGLAELPGLARVAEREDGRAALLRVLTDRVQQFAVGRQREEGRVRHRVRGTQHGQRPRAGVDGGGGQSRPARRCERPDVRMPGHCRTSSACCLYGG